MNNISNFLTSFDEIKGDQRFENTLHPFEDGIIFFLKRFDFKCFFIFRDNRSGRVNQTGFCDVIFYLRKTVSMLLIS